MCVCRACQLWRLCAADVTHFVSAIRLSCQVLAKLAPDADGNRYDVILLDIIMEGMNGDEVCVLARG